MTISREWFTTYCQNAAANVLDKDGEVRFSYTELKVSLDAASDHRISDIPNNVLRLDDNIQKLCNTRHPGLFEPTDNQKYALLLTLCNIHAAYLMVSGLWKEEPPVQTGGTDEYGFEIF